MFSLLQDWIEIEGNGNGDVIQSAPSWMRLTGYQDALFWLDLRMLTSVSTELTMHYETAPELEPTLFRDIITPFTLGGLVGPTPTVKNAYLSQHPLTPVSGLVRWHIAAVAGGLWKVSFRIHCMAKRPRA